MTSIILSEFTQSVLLNEGNSFKIMGEEMQFLLLY